MKWIDFVVLVMNAKDYFHIVADPQDTSNYSDHEKIQCTWNDPGLRHIIHKELNRKSTVFDSDLDVGLFMTAHENGD